MRPLIASSDGNRVAVGGPKSSYIECTKTEEIIKINQQGGYGCY